METTVTVERLGNEEAEDYLPSHEILRENLKADPKKRAVRIKSKKYICRICYELFEQKSDLKTHEKTHDPENPYACTQCPHKTSRRQYLTTHIRKVHKKDEYKEKCNVCGKKFLYKSLLDKHSRVHTGEKPNVCDVCGKAFNSKYSLNTHKLIHTNEKPYKCAFCDHACRDSSTLRKHQNVHLGISQKYPCLECTNRYDTKARLQEHINQTHLGVKPPRETCTICGSTYKNKRNLEIHIKAVHDKSLSCVCGICGRRLTNSSNLTSHMRTHLDIRPFKCNHPGCTSKFKERGDLKKHSRKHNLKDQMICDECGKSFTRKYRLITHLRQHEPRVKNTECPFCKVCFYNKSYLLKHLRYKHGKRQTYICDMCGFKANNKPGLVVHLRHIHTTLETQCHICRKIFKRKVNLIKHYGYKHKITFKPNDDQPMVAIKQEPIDTPDLEIDLLDIDKEEPFAGFEVDPEKEQDGSALKTTFLNSSDEVIENNVSESGADTLESVDVEQGNLENITIVIEQEVAQSADKQVEGAEINFGMAQSEEVQQESPEYTVIVIEQEVMPSGDKEIEDKQETLPDIDSKEEDTQTESGRKTMQVDEFLQSVMGDTDDKIEATGSKEDNTQAQPGRITMQVDEFLQHVMGDTDIQAEEIDEESEEYQKMRVKALVEQSNIKLGIRKKSTAYGRKLEKVHVDDLSKFLLNNVSIEVNGKIIKQKEKNVTNKKREIDTKKKRKKRKSTREEKKEFKIDKRTLSIRKGHKKVQYNRKSKKRISNYNEDSNDAKETETEYNNESKRDSNTSTTNSALKLIFNSHQCYVCYKIQQDCADIHGMSQQTLSHLSRKVGIALASKSSIYIKMPLNLRAQMESIQKFESICGFPHIIGAIDGTHIKIRKVGGEAGQYYVNRKGHYSINTQLFQTKPQLIEHCKEHFDVCNERTLKKCPLCPFVTQHDIKRHMRLMHKVNLNFSFMRIKDKKNNEDGSRYYFDVHNNDKIKKLEIIPSVKILNKKASMDIDKRNREIKDKSLLKRKLVRKGKEWIVETEKIDVSNHVVPKMKEKDNYLAKMKLLSIQSRKNKTKMLYPCNGCEKICQNLSALTLHMRRHDPNAKPFKPKRWKHKQGLQEQKEVLPAQNIEVDTSNRNAKPKPIVNNHKCDPKLKAFYENNIKGGDIEFWQFLKIFNKMNRENVNDFEDLAARTDFGVHIPEPIENNQVTTKNSSNPINDVSNTEISSSVKSVASKSIKKRVGKVKYVRKIQLTRDEYKKRCEIKNKLRDQLVKTNC